MAEPLLRPVLVCRLCHGSSANGVRFDGLSRTLCAECKGRRRVARADRLAERVRSPWWVPDHEVKARAGENTKHLAWIRSLRCCVGARGCGMLTHAHHVRSGTGAGVAIKPDDRWAVPMCPKHHSEGHTCGWQTFETKYRLNLKMLAEGLASQSPHLERSTP